MRSCCFRSAPSRVMFALLHQNVSEILPIEVAISVCVREREGGRETYIEREREARERQREWQGADRTSSNEVLSQPVTLFISACLQNRFAICHNAPIQHRPGELNEHHVAPGITRREFLPSRHAANFQNSSPGCVQSDQDI